MAWNQCLALGASEAGSWPHIVSFAAGGCHGPSAAVQPVCWPVADFNLSQAGGIRKVQIRINSEKGHLKKKSLSTF